MKISALALIWSLFFGAAFAQQQPKKSPQLESGYAFGIEVAPSLNLHVIEYDTPHRGSDTQACETKGDKNHCYNVMLPSKMSSFGVFFTKQYIPQGLWILDSGFEVNLRQYQAKLVDIPDSFEFEGQQGEVKLSDYVGSEQDLQEMSLDALNLATRFYVKAGISPPLILPDLLFTTGLGFETIYGNLKINGESHQELAVAPHVFFQTELVWTRFMGKGSLSTYLDLQFNQTTNAGRLKSIQSDEMDNFKISTASMTLGIARLVLPM
ncbi:hypothetical protein N9D31_01170 [Oligoflexaceae bacterium]|nr:hypothetical protein [Oligoflexaceae bacterium]